MQSLATYTASNLSRLTFSYGFSSLSVSSFKDWCQQIFAHGARSANFCRWVLIALELAGLSSTLDIRWLPVRLHDPVGLLYRKQLSSMGAFEIWVLYSGRSAVIKCFMVMIMSSRQF